MSIRSAYGALCAAVALTAGLVVSAGTAVAATPVLSDAAACTAARATVQTDEAAVRAATDPAVRATAIAALQAARAAERTACAGVFPGHGYPGFPGHHGFPGGGLNGGFLNGIGLGGLNVLNGNTIVLGNQQVDVCTVPTWQSFYNRYNPYFGSLRDQLNELRYQQLLAQAGCGNSGAVGDLGGLTLISGNLINLGQYGVVGGNTVNVCDFPNYDQFNGFGLHHFGGNFNPFVQHYGGFLNGNGWNQLRLRARCAPQVVVIPGSDTTTVVQAPPAPVVTAPPVPAAAPEAAAPQTAQAPTQVSRVPAGSIDTGDGTAPDVN